MFVYYANIKPAAEGGFVVLFPAVPGAVTQAETIEEARVMAEDCLRTYFLGRIAMGESIPESAGPPRGKNIYPVVLPALQIAKVQLYRTFRATGMKKSSLAAGMGISRAHIDRLFDLNHASQLAQIEAACAVLGKTLVVEVKDAA